MNLLLSFTIAVWVFSESTVPSHALSDSKACWVLETYRKGSNCTGEASYASYFEVGEDVEDGCKNTFGGESYSDYCCEKGLYSDWYYELDCKGDGTSEILSANGCTEGSHFDYSSSCEMSPCPDGVLVGEDSILMAKAKVQHLKIDALMESIFEKE
eukprot:CAMPEP_0172481910 /NCGR_PEP_ID=MMETSP1066-20121228/8098_1 /TAXON_ID=671091 /ORGANISM="Coscinodiscus wailesii, Strain CCMP2513" /LENGTH=155 /DNA_ID=CAMNT_0013244635 /DNA_START=112 /DNA_END=579 /DNA_ORIENTATION=+